MLYSIGDRIPPCGSPAFMLEMFEKEEPNLT